MKPGKSPPPAGANEEIPALIETLHQTDQRLEELSAGEADAVVDRRGGTSLLRRAQDNLRYREGAIFNSLPANIALLDSHGIIISVNESWRRFGRANAAHGPGHEIGVNYIGICDSARGDDAAEARQAAAGIRSVLDGKAKNFSMEYPCHSPTEQRWFIMTVIPLGDDPSQGAIVTHLNITERKQVENALQESKNFLQLVVENVPLRIFWKDRDLRYLGCNTQFAKDAGHTRPDELTGKTDFEMGWKDQAELYRTDDKEVLDSGAGKLDIEEPQTTPDGNTIWLRTSKVPLRDKDNQIIGILGLYQDITERRQAEKHLKLFRTLLDNSSDAIEVLEPVTLRLLDVNETECRDLGYSREELLSMKITDIDWGFNAELNMVIEAQIRQSGGARFESVYRRKDGSTFPVEVSAKLIELDKPYGLNIVRDITERKRMETALRERETEFQILTESMPQIVWITRPDGWNIYFNQHWMDYTGMTLEESLGHGWNKPFHPDDQQRAWDAWQRATMGIGIYSIESRLRRADGIYRWWLVRGVPLKDAAGNILKWFGTCTDIHDLKIAELEIARANGELRESERRFTELLGHVELISMMLDREARITYCNDYLLRLTGWKREEVIGKIWWDIFVPPELHDLKGDFFAALLANQPEALYHENDIVTRSGERRLIRWNNSVLRSADGKVIGTASIGEDITDRLLAEKNLRWRTAFFEALVKTSSDGILVVDAQGKKILQNRRLIDLWKIPEKIAENPEDKQQAQFVINQTVDAKQFGDMVRYLYEHAEETSQDEVVLKDGTILERYSAPVLDDDGHSYGRIWSFHDITDRKQAELELRESERRFSDLLGSVELVTMMLDREARITYCNDCLLRLTGWRQEDVIGKNWFALFVPPEINDLKEGFFEALLANQPEALHHENEILTRSGEHRLIRWNNSVLRSTDGDVIGTASIGEDITERRMAEAVLKQRAAELERFHRLSVGRELQMIELKKQINELALQTGQKPPYELASLTQEPVRTNPAHEQSS